jgi:hypothetical protein
VDGFGQSILLNCLNLNFFVCRLIREFDRDARLNGMPEDELNTRKKQLVQELNSFIGLKKSYGASIAQRSETAIASGSRDFSQKELDGKDIVH